MKEETVVLNITHTDIFKDVLDLLIELVAINPGYEGKLQIILDRYDQTYREEEQ